MQSARRASLCHCTSRAPTASSSSTIPPFPSPQVKNTGDEKLLVTSKDLKLVDNYSDVRILIILIT